MTEHLSNHPVFTSLDVSRHEAQLQLVQNFYDGVDKAKLSLVQYTRESDDSFAKRQSMASLSNYVKRAVDSITNIIYRKPIDTSEIESSILSPFIDTIDYQNNLTNFAKQLTSNAIKDGFTLLLVEKEVYDETVMTKADEAMRRPYFVNIQRKDIRNWKKDAQGNYEMITYDESYISEQNQYSQVVAIQQRTYFNNGTVEVWRSSKNKSVYLFETYQTGLNYIPMVRIGNSDIPPIYDLAKINANHLNLTSERRNYARVAAAPIPLMFMPDNNDGKVVTVGVNDGVTFSAPRTDAGMEWLELKGTNDQILEKMIKEDEIVMRSYLAELISDNTEKTATEVGLANTDNEAKLGHYAEITETGINKAFVYMAEYQGVQIFDAKIYINRDFYDKKLTPQEVDSYKAMYAEGIISYEMLIDLLINGEVIEPMDDTAKELEKARLSNQ